MSRPLKVVALSGGTWRPSRTLVLTQALLAELAGHLNIESHLIELGDIARPLGAALSRREQGLCGSELARECVGEFTIAFATVRRPDKLAPTLVATYLCLQGHG